MAPSPSNSFWNQASRNARSPSKSPTTGIGIPEKFHANLFEAFTQADATVARRHEGTGLGLAICDKIVALMKGKLAFSSRLGEGTTFTVQLEFPIDLDLEEILPTTYTSTKPSSAYRLLLVEDNAVNQKIIIVMLSREGYQVDLAGDGEEALLKIQQHPYDLVLMDCGLPKLDGYHCTEMIRKTLGKTDLPIVALTAHALPGDAEKCYQFGMNDYLSKPIRKHLLLNLIQKHLH